MNANRMFWIKVTFSVALILLSVFYLYPTYKLNTMSEAEQTELKQNSPERYKWLKDKEINLGLDLQGGLNLVLEVDTSQLDEQSAKDAPERAMEVVRNRIDQFGVAEPSITLSGDKRIVVQLPGVADKERATQLIQSTAQLTFQLLTPSDKIGDFFSKADENLAKAGFKALKGSKESEQKDVKDVIEGSKAASDSSKTASSDTSKTAVAATEDETPDEKPLTSRLLGVGGDVGVLTENYEVVRDILVRPEIMALIPSGNAIYWGKQEAIKAGDYSGRTYRPFYFVQTKVEMRGDGVENALVQFNSGDPKNANSPYVSLNFSETARKTFANLTGAHVNERLAIVLDNNVQSAPNIKERINSSSAQITGSFSLDEAKDLAIVLRAGALPAPLKIMEERSVGPSLGRDSIKKGIISTACGFTAVVIFMLVWYRISGLVSIIALCINVLALFASLAMLNATLTLPGIAGIVLTLGMAVDANVLIYERIREELRNGKTIRSAIEAGFGRAFWTIFDANLTTLITAVVLLQFGTGPVKGFAITLSIGIILSMYTAIVISRLFFDFFVERWAVKNLSI